MMDGEARNIFAIQTCTGSEQMRSQFMKVLIPELPQVFVLLHDDDYNFVTLSYDEQAVIRDLCAAGG